MPDEIIVFRAHATVMWPADTDLVLAAGSSKLSLLAQRPIVCAVIQEAIDNLQAALVFTCYVTAGTFARRGLSSTAKTLRSLSGVRGSEY